MQQIMENYFGLTDYVIFALVLAVSSAIGLYFRFTGGKQKTFKEYMMADNNMPVLPVAFSLMASFMSAITILGVSKENYSFGTQFIVINISYLISTPIVCYFYLPIFFRLQNTSVYEYLEQRFGRLTRISASLAFSLQMTLYMGIVLYAPALALSAVTGIPLNVSIMAVGVVCTFYSALGGIKAVLVTDVFQSLLMFAAIFAVITRGVMDFSVGEIFRIAAEGERLEFFNISPDPRERHTLWSLVIGGCFTYCSLYGVNQAQVQRLLTIRDLHRAQASLWIQWPILTVLSLSTSFAGLVVYAQYHDCDPMKSGRIANSDQLLPLYVVETMGMVPGLSGLFVSGIFSGSLSTVSSALNSLAAVTYQDYIQPCIPHHSGLRDKYATRISKILACVYGLICIMMSFLIPLVGTGILQASLTIFGAVGGPLLALFTLGMLCKCANQKGAMAGLIFGLVITLWIGFGQPKPPLPYKPVSVEGCPAINVSLNIENIQMTSNSSDKGDDIYFDGLSNKSLTLPIEVKEGMPAAVLSDLNTTLSEKSTPFLHNLYAVSYMWVAAIGFIGTMLVGVLVSIATGGNTVLDRELFPSWIHIQGPTINGTENLCTEKSDHTISGDIISVSVNKLSPDEREMSHL